MPGGKPNILVIWGDDIGLWNVSAYSRGAMGYRTPNIDRIAKEGAIFSDHYAQPSCTAGRAAFITGQLPIRTGLTTVGIPGSPLGLKPEDPTLAEVLKPLGYATGQFGKNHLGDRNEHLPTVHGFDEFFGNLYHLNAEEETMDVDYPTGEGWEAKLGPRGVLHTHATEEDDDTTDARFGRVGKQRIEDTGPLTPKRMETIDQEFIDAAYRFMGDAKDEDTPFFVWLNTTRMHAFTHVPEEYLERAKAFTSGADVHCAGMLQHDEQIGAVLKWLDDQGLTEDTIVIYSTDNGPEHSTFPHGSTTPYRSEKMTTWEGGVRVPMMVRWPGQIPAGSELNGIHCGEDVFVTLAAAAGAPDVADKLAKGADLGSGVTYKCHIDGLNQLDYWTGRSTESARDIVYYYAESHFQALRWRQWKMHLVTREGYYGQSSELEIPWLFNVRQDPFESYDQAPGPRANVSQHKSGLLNIMINKITEHLGTFRDFPPRQEATSLKVDDMIEKITRTSAGR